MKKDINYFFLGAGILLLFITSYHIFYGEINAFNTLRNNDTDESLLINLYNPWHQLTLLFMAFALTLGIAAFKNTYLPLVKYILILLVTNTIVFLVLPLFGSGIHMFIETLPQFLLFLGLDVLIFLGLKKKNT